MTEKATHWWLFEIAVENDFRGQSARIEFRWYTPVVTRFEAVWVGGAPPGRVRADDRIRVLFNGRMVGAYTRRADAVGHVRRLLAKVPAACRAVFDEHAAYLFRALEGD